MGQVKSWDSQTEGEKRATVAARKRLGTRHKHAAWRLMLGVARKLGFPRSFEADLYVHDRDTLASMAGTDEPFFWAIGETGTQLALPLQRGDGSFGRAGLLEYVRSWPTYGRPHVYVWDGLAFTHISDMAEVESHLDAMLAAAERGEYRCASKYAQHA